MRFAGKLHFPRVRHNPISYMKVGLASRYGIAAAESFAVRCLEVVLRTRCGAQDLAFKPTAWSDHFSREKCCYDVWRPTPVGFAFSHRNQVDLNKLFSG